MGNDQHLVRMFRPITEDDIDHWHGLPPVIRVKTPANYPWEVLSPCVKVRYADGREVWVEAKDYRTNPTPGSFIINDKR